MFDHFRETLNVPSDIKYVEAFPNKWEWRVAEWNDKNWDVKYHDIELKPVITPDGNFAVGYSAALGILVYSRHTAAPPPVADAGG